MLKLAILTLIILEVDEADADADANICIRNITLCWTFDFFAIWHKLFSEFWSNYTQLQLSLEISIKIDLLFLNYMYLGSKISSNCLAFLVVKKTLQYTCIIIKVNKSIC